MSLMAKLKKNAKSKEAEVLTDSKFFDRELTKISEVPIMNVALSADFDGGLSGGLTVIAGPSKHYKTSFGLVMLKSFLEEHPEGVALFYDLEFGSPQSYFSEFGIDTDRVLHNPVLNIEELKFELMGQLDDLTEDDKVFIMIDSIGNAASKKEIEDALDEKSVADMTRAKALKGLFRMVTPQIKMKDIPTIAINHTYKEQGLFPKDIVSGGTGIYYSADNIWIVGRRQIKEGKDVTGYEFIIKAEKSRFVREKANIPVTVTYDGGIDRYSGLFDLAVAHGDITSPSKGFFQIKGSEKKIRKNAIPNDFYEELLKDEEFKEYTRKIYKLGSAPTDDVVPDEEIVGFIEE